MGFFVDLKNPTPANPANPANRQGSRRSDSHDSHDSQGVPISKPHLTGRQRRAVEYLIGHPGLRRGFAGEQTEVGFVMAVAVRRDDGEIVVGELIFSEPPPLAAVAEAFAEPENRR